MQAGNFFKREWKKILRQEENGLAGTESQAKSLTDGEVIYRIQGQPLGTYSRVVP